MSRYTLLSYHVAFPERCAQGVCKDRSFCRITSAFPQRCAPGVCQDRSFCHITSPFPSAAHRAYVKIDHFVVSRRPSLSAAHRAYVKIDPFVQRSWIVCVCTTKTTQYPNLVSLCKNTPVSMVTSCGLYCGCKDVQLAKNSWDPKRLQIF